jgi:hypothetical protein
VVEGGMTATTRAPAPQAPTDRHGHQSSHRNFLKEVPSARPADPPAIVVPTIRPAAAIRDALGLGRRLGRPVIALCSRWSSARAVLEEAKRIGAHAIAVEVGDDAGLPRFGCDGLLRTRMRVERPTDVSLKRNLGLAVALMLGWRGVLFLDDDMTGLAPGAARTSFGLLGRYNVAALKNVGYPDNSVVCHARREVGLPQETFIGGGAMAVRVSRETPFFPTVYNEDWMFLVGRRRIERVVVCGEVSQRAYDPYLSPERARAEEFGDCLAEGLFALSDADRPELSGREDYWTDFRADRIGMIDEILGRLDPLPADERRRRIVQALTIARGRALSIDPATYVEYLEAWRKDLDAWRDYLAQLPRVPGPAKAFSALGLWAEEFRPEY